MEMLLIGILGCFTAFDHNQLMQVKHTESAHYSETSDRLDRHAQAITTLHNAKASPQPYKASDDSAIFGNL